jgi:hypothetical protein
VPEDIEHQLPFQPESKGHVVRRILLAVVPALALAAARPVGAEMFGPEYRPCGDQPSTLAIVECDLIAGAVHKAWLCAAIASRARAATGKERAAVVKVAGVLAARA